MKEVSVGELKKMMDSDEDFQLIDVREEHEVDIASIGGELIPMGDIIDNLDKISKDRKVVIYCHSCPEIRFFLPQVSLRDWDIWTWPCWFCSYLPLQ